ncbi:MAG: hypothetical protein ACIRZF_07905, partial [Ligilactobacillus ruminis]
LPPTPNQAHAGSKVEQNLQNLKKCSTANSKSGSRSSEADKKRDFLPNFVYSRIQIRRPHQTPSPRPSQKYAQKKTGHNARPHFTFN